MYKLPAYGGRGYATVEAVPVDTSNAPAVRDRDEGSAEVRFQRLDAPTVDSETGLTAPNGPDCRELPAATAEENAEAEALDVVLSAAVEAHGSEAIYEIDTTDRSPAAVAAEIEAVVAGDREPSAGEVTFVDYL